MNVYQVVRYSYLTGCNEVIDITTSLENAICSLQSIAASYIVKQDGVQSITDKEGSLESRVLNAKKMHLDVLKVTHIREFLIKNKALGHYIIVDKNDHIHQWSIWNRYDQKKRIAGYWSKYETVIPTAEQVYDLDIIQISLNLGDNLFDSLNVQRMKFESRIHHASDLGTILGRLECMKAIKTAVDACGGISLKELRERFPCELAQALEEPCHGQEVEEITLSAPIPIPKINIYDDQSIARNIACEAAAECARRAALRVSGEVAM